MARIAALFELAEVGRHAEAVSEVATMHAIRLGWLLIPHAQAAFGLLGTDAVDTDASAVLKWAQANGLTEFSKRDCQKAMSGRFRTQERMNKALERLVQQDALRHFTRRNKGAPSSEMCLMNPNRVLI